jgi:multidrug efflux pump subunit AcrA (membrane-fusion protein)
LASIIFRRDPKNPDKVIRMEADLGISDGKWVVVNSGLREGDEVVLDGVYELKLAGGGKATGGGHFHADGTYHEAHGPERE